MAPILSRARLTADADLVHRVLVSFGQSSSASLAGELRLSHGRVLGALSQLHTAGLVGTRGEGITRRWWASRPKDQPKDRRVPGWPGPYPPRIGALADTAAVSLGDDLRHLTSRPATPTRQPPVRCTSASGRSQASSARSWSGWRCAIASSSGWRWGS